MNFMLGVSLDSLSSFDGNTVLVGAVAVFAIIGVFWSLLTVYKKVFGNTASDSVQSANSDNSALPTSNVNTDDKEIVAVIAAAIAMAESEFGNGLKFRVVSFRRK